MSTANSRDTTHPRTTAYKAREQCLCGGSRGKHHGFQQTQEQENPKGARRFSPASMVGQLEKSSWDQEEFCWARWQRSARSPCKCDVAGAAWPAHTLAADPRGFPPSRPRPPHGTGIQIRQGRDKRDRKEWPANS